MHESPKITKAYLLIAVSLNFTSTAAALEGTSLTEDGLAEQEWLALSDAVKIVNNIDRLSDLPNWAAVYGNHLGVATHGPVGYAAVSAPTIGKALVTFVDWFKLRCDCYSSELTEQDEHFDITIKDTSGDSVFKRFFFESFMRALEVLMNLLAGPLSSQQTELYFESVAQQGESLLRETYDSRLHFGSAVNKLVVPKSLWFLPSPLSDRDSYSLNLRKCQQLLESLEQQNAMDVMVRNLIRDGFEQRVLARHSTDSMPTLQTIADQLNLSRRTLTRRLAACNTRFSDILESQRKGFANRLLRDARYSIADIADTLGYTESASFCRAFKVWHGISPSEFRRRPDA